MKRLNPPDSGLIILDCDEVLLRYFPKFGNFLTTRHGISLNGAAPRSYDMIGWTGIADRSRVVALIEEFSAGAPGFADLPPVDGAVEAVKNLSRAGFELVVLTSCSDAPETRRLRTGNLERVFGAGTFSDIVCLALDRPKIDVLRTLPRALFVDDLPKNVEAGLAAGHDAHLMMSSHNEEMIRAGAGGLPWIAGWGDLGLGTWPGMDMRRGIRNSRRRMESDMKNGRYIVEVSTDLDFEDLDSNDLDEFGECAVDGSWMIGLAGIPEGAEPDEVEEKVLDAFHRRAPIACLDDYRILVRPANGFDTEGTLRRDIGEVRWEDASDMPAP